LNAYTFDWKIYAASVKELGWRVYYLGETRSSYVSFTFQLLLLFIFIKI